MRNTLQFTVRCLSGECYVLRFGAGVEMTSIYMSFPSHINMLFPTFPCKDSEHVAECFVIHRTFLCEERSVVLHLDFFFLTYLLNIIIKVTAADASLPTLLPISSPLPPPPLPWQITNNSIRSRLSKGVEGLAPLLNFYNMIKLHKFWAAFSMRVWPSKVPASLAKFPE